MLGSLTKIKSYLRVLNAILASKIRGDDHLPHPYRLIANITGACNSLCLTCDWGRNYLSHKYTTKDEMTLDEYRRLFSDLSDLVWLSLGGGEPTMRMDMSDIAVSANELCKPLAGVDFSTNGLTPVIVERVVENIASQTNMLLEVGISLDGGPELHDHIRGVKGNWNKCMETYQRVSTLAEKYQRIGLHFNYTMSGHNTGRLPDFIEALRQAGINAGVDDISVSFANVGYAFSNMGKTGFTITDKEAAIRDMEYLLKQDSSSESIGRIQGVRRYVKKTFLSLAKEKYLQNPHEMVIPCAAFRLACFIDAHANIFPCTIWGKRLGNLRDVNFEFDKIWLSAEACKTREQIREAKCPICWSGCESTQSILAEMPRIAAHQAKTHVLAYKHSN